MIQHIRRVTSPLAAALLLSAGPCNIWAGDAILTPDHLVLVRTVYKGAANTVTVNQTLPPGCVAGTAHVPLLAGGTTNVTVSCGTATYNGAYPNVFFNSQSDGNFGVSSPIFIDQ